MPRECIITQNTVVAGLCFIKEGTPHVRHGSFTQSSQGHWCRQLLLLSDACGA